MIIPASINLVVAAASWLVMSVASPALQTEDPQTVVNKALEEFDRAQQVKDSDGTTARRLFLKAASGMEALVANGLRNGQLEYNIGNCYLQAGRIGEAILHYRRAQRLVPGDPLVEDNLTEARSRKLTSITEREATYILRGILFLHYTTSESLRLTLAMASFVTLWIVLLVRLFVRARVVGIIAAACAVVAVSLGTSVAVSRWVDRNAPDGVVTSMDVVVYKGPGESYRRQFAQPLQPGVEFTLREKRGSWWKIELPDGKMGWIDRQVAQLVPYPEENEPKDAQTL